MVRNHRRYFERPGPEDAIETIVQRLRQAHREEELTIVNILTGVLIQRSEPWIANVVLSFRLIDFDREELRRNIEGALWAAVVKGDKFWERKYGLALRRLALNEARSICRSRKHENIHDSFDSDNHRFVRSSTFAAYESEDPDPAAAKLAKKVKRLPDDLRRVVDLWLDGYPIEAKDPNKESISSIVGVTPRTIRNRMSRAVNALAEDVK
jgi:DNA-directed RNA polymerase specialized sigma24 family protein